MTVRARCVLSDKDKNAQLHIRSPRGTKGAAVQQSLNSAQKMAPPSSSPQAGNKRKIDEVDDAERVETNAVNYDNSQRTQLLSDSEAEEDGLSLSMSNVQTSYETANTSFADSQNAIEPQFELQQEEMSQRTLDRLNDVPMPQNTSQLPPLQPGLLKEMSAGSVGLSSFINFEDAPSTQGSDTMLQPVTDTDTGGNHIANATAEPAGSTVQQDQEAAARKKMFDEKAAELRTRLQLALYKVQTRQTGQPFSRLKSPPSSVGRSSSPLPKFVPKLATPQFSSSTIAAPSSASTIRQHQRDPSIDSAEAQIAVMRARATAQPKRPVRSLSSLPMPILDPQLMGDSSFGSNETQRIEDAASQEYHPLHHPTSPPLSSRRSSAGSDAQLRSNLRNAAVQHQQVQLGSPPASEGGTVEALLAKMASQGEAASGLVQLMTGATGI